MEGLAVVLTIIFVVLQLTNVIAWSWWWVLSPLWIGLGLYLVFGLILLLIYVATGNKIKNVLTRRFR